MSSNPFAATRSDALACRPSSSGKDIEGQTPVLHSRSELPFYAGGSTTVPKQSFTEDSPGWWRRSVKGWRVIVLYSWLNICLAFIPVAYVLSRHKENFGILAFVFCSLSLIPLVKLHDLTTGELALRLGGSKTGLLNASMANIVELVVAISALQKCELRVVQSSLIGAMLSKLLLVLGLCFLAGGMRFYEQGFDPTANQIHASLLNVSVGALLLPAAYHFALSNYGGKTSTIAEIMQKQSILRMSHSVSIILMTIYVAYLVFQLWSHSHFYKDRQQKSQKIDKSLKDLALGKKSKSKQNVHAHPMHREHNFSDVTLAGDNSPVNSTDDVRLTKWRNNFASPQTMYAGSPDMASSTALPGHLMVHAPQEPPNVLPMESTVRLVDPSHLNDDQFKFPVERSHGFSSTTSLERTASGQTVDNSDSSDSVSSLLDSRGSNEKLSENQTVTEPKKEPRLSWFLTILLLTFVTVGVSLIADWLVESLDDVGTVVRKEWVGLILLPAVASVAECVSAINVSVKDQLTLSISVAVGSTVQTALFVIPFVVTVAWILGKPLSLLFDPFESLVLYIAVQTMTHVVADGKSNWLEGVILIGLYCIIGVSFWFYPGSDLPTSLAQCKI